MKARLFTLGMLLFFAVSVFATEKEEAANTASYAVVNNTVLGQIHDKSTGEMLTGVEVRIEGTQLKTYTDFDGKFVFEGLKPGEYKVSANLISYKENGFVPVRIQENNETHALNIQLEIVE